MSIKIPKVETNRRGVVVPRVLQHDTYVYYGRLVAAIDDLRVSDGDAFNAGPMQRNTEYGRRHEKAVRHLIIDLFPKIYRGMSITGTLIDPSSVMPKPDVQDMDPVARLTDPSPTLDTRVALIPRENISGVVVVDRLIGGWEEVGGVALPSEIMYVASLSLPSRPNLNT